MKILVVHEERPIADTLAEYLYSQGHQVLPLYCPFDALNHFLEIIQFDAALISISLAELTGEELADVFRIKVFQPNCRVILFGFEDVVENMKARRPEFEYLTLPFENEELLSMVESIQPHVSLRKVSRLREEGYRFNSEIRSFKLGCHFYSKWICGIPIPSLHSQTPSKLFRIVPDSTCSRFSLIFCLLTTRLR